MTSARRRLKLFGERKSALCRMLGISRNTLDLWLKREEQTGDYQAITHFQKGCRHKITDWERFEEFAQKHEDPKPDGFIVGRQRDSAKHQ